MKNVTDIVIGLILLCLSALGLLETTSLPSASGIDYLGPAAFPRYSLLLLAFCSVLLIVKGFLKAPLRSYWPEPRILKGVIGFLLVFFLYLVLFVSSGNLFAEADWLPFHSGGGFAVSTVFFLLIALPLLGRKGKREILSVAFITSSVLLAVFAGFFQIVLP